MGSVVTAKDVARHAAVSVGTVSRVFNNHADVDDQVRQRVFQVAEQLGYVKPQGTRMAKTGLKDIGFLLVLLREESVIDSYWASILSGVQKQVARTHARLTFHRMSLDQIAASPHPFILRTQLQELRLDGVLMACAGDLALVELVSGLHVPIVLVDNYLAGASLDAVLGDNYEGARKAIHHLIATGHRRIAHIGGPLSSEPQPRYLLHTSERRAMGYRDALLDAGLSVDPQLIEAGNMWQEGGYLACRRLIERGREFDSIFCANDRTAVGAVRALSEAGMRVPDDVSLIGYDDGELAEHLTPALTTIRTPKEALGVTAMRALQARMREPDAVPATSLLQVELIERASVRQRAGGG